MSAPPYPTPQAIFYQQYEMARRDEIVGLLLALFLGCFGLHHFYLRRTALGVVYILFCWTGIPSLLGIIECFFMPGRVRDYNAVQAAGIAAALGVPVPGWNDWRTPANVAQPGVTLASLQTACPRCGQPAGPEARFCSGCGLAL